MGVFTALQERRSIRKYSPDPVEEVKLLKVLEAARLSPSAGNRQNWRFVVVTDRSLRNLLAGTTEYKFIAEAPVIIAACGTDTTSVMRCGQSRHTVDLSIATAYMILEAQELGLGTCWIGGFDEMRAREILEVPEGVSIVALTPLGYPAEEPGQRPRKLLEDIVSYDKY